MQWFFRDENIEIKKEGKKVLNNLKKMTHSMGGKGLKQIEVTNEASVSASVSFRKFKTQDWNRLICRSLPIARDNTFIILKNNHKHLFTYVNIFKF